MPRKATTKAAAATKATVEETVKTTPVKAEETGKKAPVKKTTTKKTTTTARKTTAKKAGRPLLIKRETKEEKDHDQAPIRPSDLFRARSLPEQRGYARLPEGA